MKANILINQFKRRNINSLNGLFDFSCKTFSKSSYVLNHQLRKNLNLTLVSKQPSLFSKNTYSQFHTLNKNSTSKTVMFQQTHNFSFLNTIRAKLDPDKINSAQTVSCLVYL